MIETTVYSLRLPTMLKVIGLETGGIVQFVGQSPIVADSRFVCIA